MDNISLLTDEQIKELHLLVNNIEKQFITNSNENENHIKRSTYQNLKIILKILNDTIDDLPELFYSQLRSSLKKLLNNDDAENNINQEPDLNETCNKLLLLIGAYGSYKTKSNSEVINRLLDDKDKIDSHVETLDNYRTQYIKNNIETNELIERLRKESELVGITKHARHFQEASNNHKYLSLFWGIVSALLAIFIVYRASEIPCIPPDISGDTFTPAFIVKVILPRFTPLVISTFLLITCIKNFKASSHNYVVNKHRQNALSSFLDFAESTKDEGIKNSLLLQATECIYKHQSSGYNDSMPDNSPSDIQTKLLELLKPKKE